MSEDVLHTPLYEAHVALSARMVPFADYAMPVSYEGVLAEHKWTRSEAGLFDVSHMGQARLSGEGAAKVIEALTPTDTTVIKPGRQKYSMLLNEQGGILDDLMISRPEPEGFFLVVNAGCKTQDFAIIEAALTGDAKLEVLDRALLALQGPKAAQVMVELCPEAAQMSFMDCGTFTLMDESAIISRSGYTGEDGFEISFPADRVRALWDTLLGFEAVKPIGLGARDSLRLEAGMPLYGHDIDTSRTPYEASLGFGVSKSRLERGDVRGQSAITASLERVRVGLKLLEGPPAREGAKILTTDGTEIGVVTSGGPSPSFGYSIAMGYVPPASAEVGTSLKVEVRGKPYAAEVVAMPFHPTSYYRKPKA